MSDDDQEAEVDGGDGNNSGTAPHRSDRFLGVDQEGDAIVDSKLDRRGRTDKLTADGDPWIRSPRAPFQRDRDRILYTRQFRRLKDVTQVARAGESYLYHDRLSHSLKVAQVGRRLAELFLERHEVIQEKGVPKELANEVETEDVPNDLAIRLADETALTDLDQRLNPDVVETACLAHDIGHPPFGHRIEGVLDKLVDDYQNGVPCDTSEEIDADEEDGDAPRGEEIPFGFEGNAQSFRIVTALAESGLENIPNDCDGEKRQGLFLTRATLNALLKYPHSPTEKENKYGYYPRTEQAAFDFARELGPRERVKTLEAEIMDYADDVTYAIHDLTDFYQDNRLPLHVLLNEAFELKQEDDNDDSNHGIADYKIEEGKRPHELPNTPEIDRFIQHIQTLDPEKEEIDTIPNPREIAEIFADLAERWPTELRQNSLTPFRGTPKERKQLDQFVSDLINRYLSSNTIYLPEVWIKPVDDEESEKGYKLQLEANIETQVWVLRKLTEFYVIRDTPLMAQQRGEEEIIRELYDALYREAVENDGDLDQSAIGEPFSSWLTGFPDTARIQDKEMHRARVIADMITTLTEPQVVQLYGRMTGGTPGSLQDRIIR